MRLPNTTLTLVLFTILGAPCLAFETWVYAQSPQPTPAPTLKVYARETIVDVTVTDAKGNPVHGLTQADFTVKEDGKAQAIRSFEEFGTQTAKILPKLPPGVYTNLQPPPSSSAVNILLLDGLNTAPTDATDPDQVGQSFAIQDRVKQGAAKFLKSMPPGTQAAVLDLSRGLRILENVSSDPELLSASVSTMDMNMDGRAATIPQWCAQQDTRNRMTLEALRQIAADTTSIKGKKNLIWFSAGMPSITDSTVNSQGGTGGSVMSVHGCLPDYTSDLLKTYGLLAAAQVVIYPVGARIMGSDIFSPIGPGPPIPPDTPITYPQYVAEEQLSLESVAEATGGTAYYNTNDLAAAAAQAVAKAASYYTISYVPPGQKYNWAHHAIKVTVDVPDAHLIYRQTYDAVDPNTLRPAPGLSLASDFAETNPANSHPDPEVTMRLAMGRAMPTSQQLLFDVQVEPSTAPAKPTDPPVFGMLDPKLKDKPLTRYSFVYALPARQITFTESPDNTRHASLEFDLAAYDSDGKLINSLGQTLKVPLTTDQYQQLMKGPFRFFQQLDLPSGQLFLRIGILDPTSAKIGTLEIPLTVPKK